MLLSLYREFKGPDISLLNKEPTFRLTDDAYDKSEGNTPTQFRFDELSLVFANYGGKGGTILDVKIDFTSVEALKRFFQDSSFHPPGLPITMKEGENYTIKFSPTLRTINWKIFALMKILESNHYVEKAVDEAIVESKDEFDRFCSLIGEREELGEASCTALITVGRIWTEVREKKFFEKIKAKNEYEQTIHHLRECLKNWDHLYPTRTELVQRFWSCPRDLISELETNLQVLGNEVSEKTLAQSRLRRDRWNNWTRVRYDKIRWFLIDKEKNLGENLERLYRKISDYDDRIQQLFYLGSSRTSEDFEPLNKERRSLDKDMKEVLKRLKAILSSKEKGG